MRSTSHNVRSSLWLFAALLCGVSCSCRDASPPAAKPALPDEAPKPAPQHSEFAGGAIAFFTVDWHYEP